MRTALMVFAAVLLLPGAARAESPWGFGARVGGYGFRSVEQGTESWDDCRMNGVGLFAQRRLGRHFFVEAGLDQYNATGAAVEMELMDRVSTHATVAGGLRMFPGYRISPYVQIGGGLEVTSVRMGGHGADDLLPTGFIGVGADLRIVDHVHVGANLRFHMMGHYDHHAAGGEMHAEPMPASQAQFFLRYDM